MSLFNKDFWDRLPDSPDTVGRAESLTGLDLSIDIIGRGLRWLAEQTEAENMPRWGDDAPEWKRPGSPDIHEQDWSIRASGLDYKPSFNYMTAEGWPLGTTCWYVQIEAGWRAYVCAETPELAVVRALIFFATVQQLRPVPPKHRNLEAALAPPIRRKGGIGDARNARAS